MGAGGVHARGQWGAGGEGWAMILLCRVVCEVCPDLAGFLSAAANRGHGSERTHTSITHLHQTAQLFKAAKQNGLADEMAWESVKNELVDQTSMSWSEAKDYTAFAAAWCGGVDGGRRLEELAQTEKTTHGIRVDIPCGIYGASCLRVALILSS